MTANSGKPKSPRSTASSPSPPRTWSTATLESSSPAANPSVAKPLKKPGRPHSKRRATNNLVVVNTKEGCNGHSLLGHAAVVDAPFCFNTLKLSLPRDHDPKF